MSLDSCPSEVSQFASQGVIQENVETLEISMKNGLLVSVQVVNSFGNVKSKFLPKFPVDLDR